MTMSSQQLGHHPDLAKHTTNAVTELPSVTTPPKKKMKIKLQFTTKQDIKTRSVATGPGSQFAISDNTLDRDSMEEGATGRPIPTVETAVSPHETALALQETALALHSSTRLQSTTQKRLTIVIKIPRKRTSLGDLPLELLFMIFDYAACRDHLRNKHYLIRLEQVWSPRPVLLITQPALLMACTYFRSVLSGRFYSKSSFHAKIEARWILGRDANDWTVQQLENKLPCPLRLSTIRLTIDIGELSEYKFHTSILVELGKKLFDEYRTSKLEYKEEGKLTNLHWRLVCTDHWFAINTNGQFDDDLQLLLEDIHKTAARSAMLKLYDFQEFGALLARWLKKPDRYKSDLTKCIRRVLSTVMTIGHCKWDLPSRYWR